MQLMFEFYHLKYLLKVKKKIYTYKYINGIYVFDKF